MQVRQRTQPSSTNSPNPFRGAIPFEAPRTAGGKAAPASRSPRDRILRHRASPEGATHLRARSTVGRDDSHKFEKDKYGNVQQRTAKCPSSHFRREQMLFSAPYSPVRLQTNPRMRSAAVRTATSQAKLRHKHVNVRATERAIPKTSQRR